MLVNRFGRLPVLWWSQVLALAFLIGCTFAPNLGTFAGETQKCEAMDVTIRSLDPS